MNLSIIFMSDDFLKSKFIRTKTLYIRVTDIDSDKGSSSFNNWVNDLLCPSSEPQRHDAQEGSWERLGAGQEDRGSPQEEWSADEALQGRTSGCRQESGGQHLGCDPQVSDRAFVTHFLSSPVSLMPFHSFLLSPLGGGGGQEASGRGRNGLQESQGQSWGPDHYNQQVDECKLSWKWIELWIFEMVRCVPEHLHPSDRTIAWWWRSHLVGRWKGNVSRRLRLTERTRAPSKVPDEVTGSS